MPTNPVESPRGLSKSKLLSWLQCAKRLWLEVHRPEAAVTSAATERVFKAGHDVGGVAKKLERGGVLIGFQQDLPKALAQTSAHIQSGSSVLFEPTFQYRGVLVRADILRRRKNGYQIREVKASTSVKDYHHQDGAIQAWVLRGAGLKIGSVAIQHIDSSFIYPGGGDYRGLFAAEDVDDDIRPLAKEVPKWVDGARATLAGREPEIRTGKHCREPYECPCFDYCSAQEPQTEYPLSVLPNAGRIIPQLVKEGYRDVRDIPPGRLRSENQERVRRITKSGKWELSSEAKKEMRKHSYPRYHFDFETIGVPIPIWAGTRPYQQIPFQWSCHVERSPGKIEHKAHLDVSGNPPMQGVAESLLDALGASGPILSHNADFEQGRIEDLAKLVPKRARELRKLVPRFVDTLSLAKAYYYHPSMKGSWSLKFIVPTIAPELDYENLGEVQEGGEASDAFAELIAPETDPKCKAQLKAALERYCERDTLALVRLARFLQAGR